MMKLIRKLVDRSENDLRIANRLNWQMKKNSGLHVISDCVHIRCAMPLIGLPVRSRSATFAIVSACRIRPFTNERSPLKLPIVNCDRSKDHRDRCDKGGKLYEL